MFYDSFQQCETAVRQYEEQTNTRFLVMKQRKCGLLIYFTAILQHIDRVGYRLGYEAKTSFVETS